MDGLPKYIQNANRIIETLDALEGKTWTRTQRELGVLLGLSQPELSNLIKLLRETDHIKHGHALPGRGKMQALILVDSTPFDGPPARRESAVHAPTRVIPAGETLDGAWDLTSLSLEQVGSAIVHMIEQHAAAEERHLRSRSELNDRVTRYREQLNHEREVRIHLAREVERLERNNEQLSEEVTMLRTEVNKLLMRVQENRKGGFPITDMVDSETLQSMQQLVAKGEIVDGDSHSGRQL